MTWALVPVRSFRRGKSRLAHVGDARPALARLLCEHVLTTLAATPGIAGIAVATDAGDDDDDVAALARARGARVIVDPGPAPLASIIDRGLAELARSGARAAIALMADLPRLTVADVAALLGALDGFDAVLAPDRDELGTNALGLRLPAAVASCFGHADSYRRHVEATAGLRVATCRRGGLAFDLDLPGDLAALVAAAEAEPRVLGERAVRAERGAGVVDAVQRIADLVTDVVRVERPQHAVQRRPLGGDPAGAARRAS